MSPFFLLSGKNAEKYLIHKFICKMVKVIKCKSSYNKISKPQNEPNELRNVEMFLQTSIRQHEPSAAVLTSFLCAHPS